MTEAEMKLAASMANIVKPMTEEQAWRNAVIEDLREHRQRIRSLEFSRAMFALFMALSFLALAVKALQ